MMTRLKNSVHSVPGIDDSITVDWNKLLGESASYEVLDILNSNYASALVFFLRNIYSETAKVYPIAVEDAFQSFRDYSKVLETGDDPSVVIFSNEPIAHNKSNGRGFGVYPFIGYEKISQIRTITNAIAKHYGIDGDDYLKNPANHDCTLESLVDDNVLSIPLSLVAHKTVSGGYMQFFLPLMYKFIESLSLNACNTIFVLTDPAQEIILPLLQKRDHPVIKSYELEDPATFIDEIHRVRKLITPHAKISDIAW